MFELVIGLEIHIQVKTKTKMFSRVSANYFNTQPNTAVDPLSLGLPGTLPVPNKLAIKKALQLALALNCKISKITRFDRKNYFYPDLPKGYQISQFDFPIGKEGFLEYDINDDSKRARITRIHLEEDTGKSLHDAELTLLDYNKAGVPLIEIVTEPDFCQVAEVTNFAKRLKQTVKYLNVSDANMEKGQMRFELNISLKNAGTTSLPKYKVEVKNIGSISVLEKVINYEYQRQAELLKNGKTPVQETRGLVDMSGKTQSQRLKEGSADYRYFEEPDIPAIKFSDEYILLQKSKIIELPQQKKHRYVYEYSLEPDSAETIISSKEYADWFDKAIEKLEDKSIIKEVAKWMIGDVFGLIKANKLKLSDLKFAPQDLTALILMLKNNEISGNIAKGVLVQMFKTGKLPQTIVKEQNLAVISNEKLLKEIILEVIKENQKVVADIEKNPNAKKFLFGQIMNKTKGKADYNKAMQLLDNLLKN